MKLPPHSRTSRGARRPLALLISLALLGAATALLQSSPAGAAVNCSGGSTVNVVAHQDDDLLFLSPDLIHDLRSTRCVETVYLTAGDGGLNEAYWIEREAGIRAAYAQILGVADSWTSGDAGVGHAIRTDTLDAAPRVSVAFLRLPDGNIDGSGFAVSGNESLQKLWENNLGTIHALDGSTSYGRDDLIGTLHQIMARRGADVVNTQDAEGAFGDGDHSDHHAAALLALAARDLLANSVPINEYLDYAIANSPANVTGADATDKASAFYLYATHDNDACQSAIACAGSQYETWLTRQIIDHAVPAGAGHDNSAPVPTISTPLGSTTFSVGDHLNVSGSATDAEDSLLPDASLTWTFTLLTCTGASIGTCTDGPQTQVVGHSTGSYTVPELVTNKNELLRISLAATDSEGATGTDQVVLHPVTSTVSVTTDPAGLFVNIDGTTSASPATKTVVAGTHVSVSLGASQVSGGTTYSFHDWSDGGAVTHPVTAVAGGVNLVAHFQAPAPTPTTTTTVAPTPTPAPVAAPAAPVYSAAMLAYFAAIERAKVDAFLRALAKLIAANKAKAKVKAKVVVKKKVKAKH